MDDETKKLLSDVADGQTWTLAVLGALVEGYADLPRRINEQYKQLTQPPAEAGQPAPDNGSGTKEDGE